MFFNTEICYYKIIIYFLIYHITYENMKYTQIYKYIEYRLDLEYEFVRSSLEYL